MPKIEVNEKEFFTLAGCPGGKSRWNTKEQFEEALSCAKAELDGDSDKNLPEEDRILKIELNDTNRPDLWGTAGCARQLNVYHGGKIPSYSFFSSPQNPQGASYTVVVEKSVQKVRPYLAGFVAAGRAISDPMLRDMIQTQEKLAWNFGRKRRTISMGLYRISMIRWPIIYKGVDPGSVSFVPLQWEGPLTLSEILKQHPKGKEYAFIQAHEPIHPLLTDSTGEVLSYPPIINSAGLGAVQVGDRDLFVELTGTDQASVTLAASIVACDLADNGFTIKPVAVEYQYDTPFGRTCVTPYYFQEPVFCALSRIEKYLGEKIDAPGCVKALARMGVRAEEAHDTERGAAGEAVPGVRAWPPEYRNDFLHAADVMEDIMMGRGLTTFKPERPRDFTVGRLSPVTVFSRRIKEIMIGMGYQEMIYNYLGSYKDLVEKMRGAGESIIRISNPMTENYEYARDSILASLMQSESASGHAAYPHRIFETGKIVRLEGSDNSGTVTRQYLGFLEAGSDANFNGIAAELQTLFYYLSREYNMEESGDSRFIPGRAAAIFYRDKPVGVMGELHPELLENWGVTVPCTACELDAEALL
ncbi:MAG: phenylalanine--tRNA ligase subunit beta [Spirochaetaceae bacterium]|jgi:phenylalanyl-tRNA synthetase beta chain|nr:phenylalanine--tRNA ligase subunit beta [Spirochaetaceae bacterium]